MIHVLPHDLRWARPMVVTAHLTEPLVYSRDLLHLDATLAFAAWMDLPRDLRDRIPPVSDERMPIDIRIPLARWEAPAVDASERPLCRARGGGLWGWCASAEVATWERETVAEVRKRPPIGEMVRWSRSGSSNPSLGATKAYDLKLPAVVARTVTWYALGDIDRVRELLTRHVRSIGRKRNQGWGTVGRWDAAPADVDRSLFDAAGLPMRRLPERALDTVPPGADLVFRRGAIRPPYYHAMREVFAVEPVR